MLKWPSICLLLTMVILSVVEMCQAEDHATGLISLPPGAINAFPTAPEYRNFVPGAVDLSHYFPLIGQQGSQGSCVSWAVGFAARAYYARMVEARDEDFANTPSPAFIYNATHVPSTDDKPCSGGSVISQALELLRHGVMSLEEYPYDDAVCPTLTKRELEVGRDFRIDDYYSVGAWNPETGRGYPGLIEAIKAQLAQGNPVIVGIDVDKSFHDLHGPAGLEPWDPAELVPGEEFSGHAVVLVGYDDVQGTLKLINSWSAEWGDNGFGRITYQGFMNRAHEAWIIGMPGVTLDDGDFRPDVVGPAPPIVRTEPYAGKAQSAGRVAVDGLWCGHVEVGSEGGTQTASGFVETADALAVLRDRLGPAVDMASVEVAPWPLCETRLVLSAALEGPAAPLAELSTGDDGSTLVTVSGGSPGPLYIVTFDKEGIARVVETAAGRHEPVSAEADAILALSFEQPLTAELPSGKSARDFLDALRTIFIHGQHVTASLARVD